MTISVDVLVSAEVPVQNIGTMSAQARYVEANFLTQKKWNWSKLVNFELLKVSYLGRWLEHWHCHSGSRERQERSLWKDCAHNVRRGDKEIIMKILVNVPDLEDFILHFHCFLFHAMTCDQPQDEASVFSSTPLVQRKCLFPDQHNATDLSCTLPEGAGNETVRYIVPIGPWKSL